MKKYLPRIPSNALYRTGSMRRKGTKPYVIFISADGFRYDFAEKYNAKFLKKSVEKAYRQFYVGIKY